MGWTRCLAILFCLVVTFLRVDVNGAFVVPLFFLKTFNRSLGYPKTSSQRAADAEKKKF